MVERVRMADTGVAIEGSFELPALARLTDEDQVFVAAFMHSHGSIKQMEKWFGISYPTVKNRLNRVAEQLEFVEFDTEAPRTARGDEVLERLERGDITPDQALEELEG